MTVTVTWVSGGLFREVAGAAAILRELGRAADMSTELEGLEDARGEPEPSKDPNQNADGPSATSKPEPDPDDESLPLTFGCFSFDCFGD